MGYVVFFCIRVYTLRVRADPAHDVHHGFFFLLFLRFLRVGASFTRRSADACASFFMATCRSSSPVRFGSFCGSVRFLLFFLPLFLRGCVYCWLRNLVSTLRGAAAVHPLRIVAFARFIFPPRFVASFSFLSFFCFTVWFQWPRANG